MQKAVTRDISVSVETRFLDSDSDPDEAYFVWAYRITIENLGDETVQLLTRHWQITDSQGRLQEVRGEGVVGERPAQDDGGGEPDHGQQQQQEGERVAAHHRRQRGRVG